MNSFYQPLQATSFLALRTNTEMFKPPSSAFRRPSLLSDGRIAGRLPLQIQPDMSPEVPEAIINLLLGSRKQEDAHLHHLHRGIEATWNPTHGNGSLTKIDPAARHRTALTAPKERLAMV